MPAQYTQEKLICHAFYRAQGANLHQTPLQCYSVVRFIFILSFGILHCIRWIVYGRRNQCIVVGQDEYS